MGRGKRMIEVCIDTFEIGDDGASECGETVENEQIRVAAWRQLMVEVHVDAIGLAAAPGHLTGEAVGRCRSGRDDVRGLQAGVENHFCAGVARLLEQAAIERSVFGAAPDEPSVRFAASNPALRGMMVVERGPVGGAKIEVAGDTDAIEKQRHRLRLRRRLDNLQVADEARADVRLRLMDLHRPSALGERNGRGQARWPRACNNHRLHLVHVIAVIPL